jgi:hypothetical protein
MITTIVAFCDDHIFLVPSLFQPILPPFKDPAYGAVEHTLRMRQAPQYPRRSIKNVFHYLACEHMSHRNFELPVMNRIDVVILPHPRMQYHSL